MGLSIDSSAGHAWQHIVQQDQIHRLGLTVASPLSRQRQRPVHVSRSRTSFNQGMDVLVVSIIYAPVVASFGSLLNAQSWLEY